MAFGSFFKNLGSKIKNGFNKVIDVGKNIINKITNNNSNNSNDNNQNSNISIHLDKPVIKPIGNYTKPFDNDLFYTYLK